MNCVRIPSSTPTAPLSLCPVVLHIFNTSNGKVIEDGAGSSTLSQKGATAERQLVYTDKSYELSQHIRGNGCKLNILMH